MKQAENLEFRRYLADHHSPVEPFQILATDIQHEIDCKACGNCCRYGIVNVSPAEIAGIAQCLGCEADEVVRQYTTPDPGAPSEKVLRSEADGCVFLDGNLCAIYDARPKACRDFPHVAPGKHSLGARFASITRWAPVCPIIFNALEEYKHRVGYHPRHAKSCRSSRGCE